MVKAPLQYFVKVHAFMPCIEIRPRCVSNGDPIIGHGANVDITHDLLAEQFEAVIWELSCSALDVRLAPLKLHTNMCTEDIGWVFPGDYARLVVVWIGILPQQVLWI